MAKPRRSPDAAGSRICLGVVIGAQGVRGEVRIKTFTDDPEAIGAYGPVTDESGRRQFRIAGLRPGKAGVVVAAIEGITDRNAAEALKGTRLYVARAALPELEADAFYHADLVGLDAWTEDGVLWGRVAAVHNFGAGDILEIAKAGGPTELVPFTREVVPEVDIEAGTLTIVPPGVVEAKGEGEEEEEETKP